MGVELVSHSEIRSCHSSYTHAYVATGINDTDRENINMVKSMDCNGIQSENLFRKPNIVPSLAVQCRQDTVCTTGRSSEPSCDQSGMTDSAKCRSTILKQMLKERIKEKRKQGGMRDLVLENEQPKKYEMTAEEIDKDRKRKESNRQSALKSRQKQKEEAEKYEKLFEEVQEENMDLEVKVKKMENEKQSLVQKLQRIMPLADIQMRLCNASATLGVPMKRQASLPTSASSDISNKRFKRAVSIDHVYRNTSLSTANNSVLVFNNGEEDGGLYFPDSALNYVNTVMVSNDVTSGNSDKLNSNWDALSSMSESSVDVEQDTHMEGFQESNIPIEPVQVVIDDSGITHVDGEIVISTSDLPVVLPEHTSHGMVFLVQNGSF